MMIHSVPYTLHVMSFEKYYYLRMLFDNMCAYYLRILLDIIYAHIR